MVISAIGSAEAFSPPSSKAQATRAQREPTLARPRGASAREGFGRAGSPRVLGWFEKCFLQ
nr:hypothetical protein [Candidatus Sigynarchaeota archaeon]